jgi:hypothetical protein
LDTDDVLPVPWRSIHRVRVPDRESLAANPNHVVVMELVLMLDPGLVDSRPVGALQVDHLPAGAGPSQTAVLSRRIWTGDHDVARVAAAKQNLGSVEPEWGGDLVSILIDGNQLAVHQCTEVRSVGLDHL